MAFTAESRFRGLMEGDQASRFHSDRSRETPSSRVPTARRQGRVAPKQLGSVLSSRGWTYQA
jgi:hypothetical protein